MKPRRRIFLLWALLPLATAGPAGAQDLNILLPADSAEYLLTHASFELPDALPGVRVDEDRTKRVSLWFGDGTGVLVQWAAAPRRGERFNNVPRYEIAAYELQKLFLDESEYVVPPTAARMLPLDWYRTVDEDVDATFDDGRSVLVVLQYFLWNTSDENVFDEDRFEEDPVYARHWANVNLLTYLIEHKDANQGNLRISTDESNPRVFAVDNGVALRSRESNRGTRWSRLHVDRFPRETVERLRALTEEDLHRDLGVLAQFALREEAFVRVEPTENLRPGRGIREEDGVVQIGLEDREIRDIWRRIETFLRDVDRGRIDVF